MNNGRCIIQVSAKFCRPNTPLTHSLAQNATHKNLRRPMVLRPYFSFLHPQYFLSLKYPSLFIPPSLLNPFSYAPFPSTVFTILSSPIFLIFVALFLLLVLPLPIHILEPLGSLPLSSIFLFLSMQENLFLLT